MKSCDWSQVNSNDNNRRPPVASTYCSDPNAKFTVESLGPDSAGIQGYFTNEFDANRVANFYKEMGHVQVSIKPYDPKAKPRYGIHPLVVAHMEGYSP